MSRALSESYTEKRTFLSSLIVIKIAKIVKNSVLCHALCLPGGTTGVGFVRESEKG